jgi:hypothetical protein
MSRNILLSFVFHILILVMTGILYTIGNHPVLLVFVLLLALFGYVVLGYTFLKPMRSVIKNLLSVSFVSLVGLLIGVYCMTLPSQMGFNWMIFLGYNLYVFGLAQSFQFDPGPLHTIWFFVAPSLSLWIGLQFKVASYKS